MAADNFDIQGKALVNLLTQRLEPCCRPLGALNSSSYTHPDVFVFGGPPGKRRTFPKAVLILGTQVT